MFVKLTRWDGLPVWINAGFVVTVEPRKLGGSIVVPMGDGMDYDVKERPEEVLALLGETVAVPAVENEPGPLPAPVAPEPAEDAAEKPVKKARKSRMTKTATKSKKSKSAESSAASVAPVDVDQSVASESTPAPVNVEPSPVAPEAPTDAAMPVIRVTTRDEGFPLADEQLDRLRKMAPRSVKKLVNTLVAQFKAFDPDRIVAQLAERGILVVERDHVVWK